VELIITPEDIN